MTVIFSIGVTNIFADSTETQHQIKRKKSPSTKYSTMRSLYKNKGVTILSKLATGIADGIEEYLKSNVIIEESQITVIGKVVNADILNVRKGPSISFDIIGTLSGGDKVKIIGESNGWYKVSLNGKEGWASKQYIKVSGNSSSSNTSQTASSNNSQGNVVCTMNVVATAYTGYSTTSTGQKPVWGTIAVDPKIIPYGTKVYIPQFGRTFIANNTGGAIKGNKIDIFMNTKKECYNWGRRTIEIQILG